MDDDGLLSSRSNLHLPQKDPLLLFAWGVVVVVIQPDFAAGYHLRLLQQLIQGGKGSFVGKTRLVGMDAGGGEDARHSGLTRIPAAQVERSVHGVGAIADPN